MTKHRTLAVILLILSILGGYFIYSSQQNPQTSTKFKLGLDLSGGTHLVYQADTSGLKEQDISTGMQTLRDVIDRRVNLFGVSEPLVQVEEGGRLGGNTHKLIVELPGVTDINQAIAAIGKTPILEFKLIDEKVAAANASATTTPPGLFVATGLTGRLLENANLEFDSRTGEPHVTLVFNPEGRDLFAKVTKENVGKQLAIFLDGGVLSSPVIRETIADGRAQISGGFTPKEAQELVRNLNFGALPVPISLIGTQKIGASLGEDALHAGVNAGVIAFIVISIFLILWYRLPGLVAVVALAIYVVINLLLFKLLPGPLQITLTSAGIAAFILSVGMAVDANILIFERMKEELKRGKNLHDAMHEGFARAWPSIRDSNLSSIITAICLYMLASSPVIKGFAYVFGIGVLTSMFTAITVSRTLLYSIAPKNEGKLARFLFNHKAN